MFVRNCWYVAAWDHELDDGKLLARRVLNEPLLLYRTAAGETVALADRCAHRHAPLSLGRREGDRVRCLYHGLCFESDGRCVEIPGVKQVPKGVQVRKYPVVVQHKWVFVWMGEPSAADRALLPDNHSCDHPDWRNLPGYLHYDTGYEHICDNLLDFSHLSYVHERTLGGSPAIAQSRPVVEALARGVRVTREVKDVPTPPFYKAFSGIRAERVDRWFHYDFLLPGTLLMASGGRPVGAAAGDDGQTVRLHSCQTLTPETESSTHYFFQQSHPATVGDATMTQAIYDQLVLAFEEDRRMITAQALNVGSSDRMTTLWMDEALIAFRRVRDHAIEIERTQP